jgi:hypothetical protein
VLRFIGKSRHAPVDGDIFLLRIEEQEYLVGRVVDTEVAESEWEGGGEGLCLIYVFRFRIDGISIPEYLPVSELLIPPLIVGDLWADGFAKHVTNRAFRDGERFERHCFKVPYATPDRYYDERARRLDVPFEPCVDGRLYTIKGLDELIAEQLGIPLRPDADEPGEVGAGEDQFIVVIPDPVEEGDDPNPSLDIGTIEETLEEALKDAKAEKAGEWEGHGYDMELRCWDIRFEGPDPKRMSKVMLPALKRLGLPRGSYVLVGGKRRKRIDL